MFAALVGIWQCNNVEPIELATAGCVLSMTLHIRSPAGNGPCTGMLLRQEQWPGRCRRICLPVHLEMNSCQTILRLLDHHRRAIDELQILALGTHHLLVNSIISHQTITFKKKES